MQEKHMFTSIFLVGVLLVFAMYKPPADNSSPPAKQLSATPAPADTMEWHRPRFEERNEERSRLVELLENQGIGNRKVLEAMRHVPRHRFIPKGNRSRAYRNTPLPIGQGQTISQPYIVAYMTDMLELEAGDKVLEIGTGSGYQAAVLSELTPEVFTIEIIRPLGEQARSRYKELGYKTIRTEIGDGYYGWKQHAPFDAIIVTAAAGHIPSPLVQQLKKGGVMAIPLGGPYETQTLMKITKSPEGDLQTQRLIPVRFVPMTGAVQERE